MAPSLDDSLGSVESIGFWRELRGDLWRFFTSIKLAILLILLGALVALVGTLIPQEDTTRAVDYISRYGPAGYRWIQQLQLDHIFSSWYFIAVLTLFFVNMSCCTVKRLRRSLWYVRAPLGFKPPAAFAALPLQARLELATLPWDRAALKRRLGRVLSTAHYRVKLESDEQLVAEKWRWERFAIDTFHISLLIILIGGLMTSVWGFKTFEVMHKGQLLQVPGGGFTVRVDDFWSNNYPNSERVMDWHTRLTVLQAGRPVLTKTIEVNDPLEYRGIRFYQSAFGIDWQNGAHLTIQVVRASDQESLGSWSADVKKSFNVPQAKLQVKIGAFLPDFALTSNQIAYSKTQRLDNPAAYLEIYDDQGNYLYRTWVFAQHPELQDMLQGAGVHNPYLFYLKGQTAPEFTGIQVRRDPGFPVVFVGFILLIGGLVTHFYFNHKVVWLHLSTKPAELLIGARVRGGSRGARGEFAALVKQINKGVLP